LTNVTFFKSDFNAVWSKKSYLRAKLALKDYFSNYINNSRLCDIKGSTFEMREPGKSEKCQKSVMNYLNSLLMSIMKII